MNFFKSHFFRHHKGQRNGIFFLVLIIVIFQLMSSFSFFSFESEQDTLDSLKVLSFQKKIDSLKIIQIENRKPKIFPFNPNYISDYKGAQLGMYLIEIDRLIAFRKTGEFVNSKEEFQHVTKVSDSLLGNISIYFKFPDWVIEKSRQASNIQFSSFKREVAGVSSVEVSTRDLNLANLIDFQFIKGVNTSLAERIVQYRSKLKGFSFESQLYEVFEIKVEVAQAILEIFTIVEKPIIKKINVNTIKFKELLKIPYINFELCKEIFNYRDEVAELQDISELKNIIDFPLDKYDRIVLYLIAE